MKPYYVWKAVFKDDSELNQFDGDKENLFKEIEKRMDDLTEFHLYPSDSTIKLKTSPFHADVQSGVIYCGVDAYNSDLAGKSCELIFKRRNTVRVNPLSGDVLDNMTVFILGLKSGDEERILEIFPGQENKKPFLKFDKVGHNKDLKLVRETFDIDKKYLSGESVKSK